MRIPSTTEYIARQTIAAQEALRALTGSDYHRLLSPWRELMRCVAEGTGKSFGEVAAMFLKDLDEADILTGSAAAWVLCALWEESVGETLAAGGKVPNW